MADTDGPDRTWPVMAVLGAVFIGMLALSNLAAESGAPSPVSSGTGVLGSESAGAGESAGPSASSSASPSARSSASPSATAEPEPTPEPTSQPTLPGGATRIFEDGRILVAYYGSAQTAALGVLGEGSPDRMVKRLKRAAAPFARPGRPPQIVFELIVTIADPFPGPSGAYSHDIPRREAARYIRAAKKYGALVVLDIQPGRQHFLTAAKRWEWALRKPHVGLALDPEWRMGRREVPGRVIGSVAASEVNTTSAWLSRLVVRRDLPQKLLVLHQFRTDMIRDIQDIEPRRGLVTVQHVDGFGTPGQKLDTFRTVIKPRRFFLGWKLFYDEDRPLMTSAQVKRIRPKVQFVSYQ